MDEQRYLIEKPDQYILPEDLVHHRAPGHIRCKKDVSLGQDIKLVEKIGEIGLSCYDKPNDLLGGACHSVMGSALGGGGGGGGEVGGGREAGGEGEVGVGGGGGEEEEAKQEEEGEEKQEEEKKQEEGGKKEMIKVIWHLHASELKDRSFDDPDLTLVAFALSVFMDNAVEDANEQLLAHLLYYGFEQSKSAVWYSDPQVLSASSRSLIYSALDNLLMDKGNYSTKLGNSDEKQLHNLKDKFQPLTIYSVVAEGSIQRPPVLEQNL